MRTLRSSTVQGPAILTFLFLASLSLAAAQSPQRDESSVIRGIDAAVKARFEAVLAYTVTEHYLVFRSNDQTHPASEMTVRTQYNRDTGKSYTIVSHGGSELIRRFVLDAILEREKEINQPGVREGSWLTSANYEMKLEPGNPQQVNGRDCFAISINPRQKAPNLILGTIWVDAKDDSIVRLQGTNSKSISLFTGPAQLTREYASTDGFSMATHARAVSNSSLFGQTVVTIDYHDYQIELRPPK
jgi:hypothetical protein